MLKSGLYTDLDTILDTRLSTIFNLNKDASIKAMKGDYHVRTRDVFEDIDFDEYQKAYKNRDKKILSSAMITRILNLVIEFAEVTYKTNIEDKEYTAPLLYLNTYPYNLTEEVESKILAAVAVSTNKQIDIELINKSYKELTPEWINKNLDMICIYNYNTWLDSLAINDYLKEGIFKDITLLAPKVIFSKEKPDVDIELLFEDMKKYLDLFINVQFMPVFHYSIVMKLVKKD